MIGIRSGTVDLTSTAIVLPDNLQIYPSGDSITCGGSAPAGYRGPLASLLAPTAPGFRYVGDSQEAPGILPPDQRQHGGHASYSTWDIERNLDGLAFGSFAEYGEGSRDPHGGHWLTGLEAPLTYTVPERGTFTYGPRAAISPDVVLLLVGTNDVFRLRWDQQSNAGGNVGRQRYRAMLDKLTTLRPDSDIFAAMITPYNNAASSLENQRVRAYNTMVTNVVRKAREAGRKVHLVDLNTGYQGGFVDALHPNAAGYNWMARRWHSALLAALGRPAR